MRETITLSSLAMLKVDVDVRNRDYFDYLVPFVIHVLKKNSPDVVTDRETSQWILEEFGLVIPAAAIQLVLKRLSKRKLLRKEHGQYFIAIDLPEQDIQSKQAEAKRHIDTVLNALRKYAEEEYSTNWSETEVNDLMLAFLSQFSIDFLRTYIRGTAIPDVRSATQSDWYIINSFITQIHTDNLPLFESMIILVKAHMLANALTCPDLDSFSKKFEKATFYLDTSLILALLGLHGETEYKTTLELLQILKNLGARIAIFEHTVKEVYHMIHNCERHLENPKAYQTKMIIEMRRKQKTPSDIALQRTHLNQDCRQLGIVIRKTPSYSRTELQIDESRLETMFLEVKLYHHNPEAKKLDINSVRSIYVLRQGSSPVRIEDAKAVFVTSNTNFARAAYRYGKELEASREVSSVVTDFSLANVAWLKAPLGAPDLPKSELIAISYAALEPGKNLWSKYLGEIEKLEAQGDITSEDHEILRYTLTARDELMNLTLGSEDALAVQTVTDILERTKNKLVSEKQQLLDKEKQLHEQTRSERDEFKQSLSDRDRHLYWLSEKYGTIVASILKICLLFLLIIFTILVAIPARKLMPIPILYVTGFVGVIFISILQILNLCWDLSINKLCDNIQKTVSAWFYVKLTSVSDLQPQGRGDKPPD